MTIYEYYSKRSAVKKLCSAKKYSKIYCMTERMKHTAVNTVNSAAETAVVFYISLFLHVIFIPVFADTDHHKFAQKSRDENHSLTTYAVLRPE